MLRQIITIYSILYTIFLIYCSLLNAPKTYKIHIILFLRRLCILSDEKLICSFTLVLRLIYITVKMHYIYYEVYNTNLLANFNFAKFRAVYKILTF